MCQKILADLANGVTRPEIFAIAADQQLLDQVAGILRQLDRVVVPRKNRRLVEPECRFQLSPVLKQFFRAVNKFTQDFACGTHDLGNVGRRMQFRAADSQSVQKRVEKVVL